MRMFGKKPDEQTLPGALKELWEARFFTQERPLRDVAAELSRTGMNPTTDYLRIGLSRAAFLTQRGSGTRRKYIQKYAPTIARVHKDVLPRELVSVLRTDFKAEIDDLKLNFGRSGTCTAFLLRKILEKLIFISFAKNRIEEKLRDKDRDLVGLKAMLKACQENKINGKPFLLTKTAKEIEGIKFLGDASAHNPLANVSMDTIVPMMPFIITAYTELTLKLGR